MKKTFLICGILFSVSACGRTWVLPPGGSVNQFHFDHAKCEAVANEVVTLPVVTLLPTTFEVSGTVYGPNGQSATYSGTGYSEENEQANFNARLDRLVAEARQQEIIESCMLLKGYSLQSKQAYSGPTKGVFSADVKTPSDSSSVRETDLAFVTTKFDVKIKANPGMDEEDVGAVPKGETARALKENNKWVLVEYQKSRDGCTRTG